MNKDKSEPLTSENVHRMFINAMFQKEPTEEQMKKAIKVHGITLNVGFDPDRLLPMKEEIKTVLLRLGDEFMEGAGDGFTFLAAYMDRDGRHWGEHNSIQELVMLGVGCGLVEYTTDRIQWRLNDGGMPHFRIKNLTW